MTLLESITIEALPDKIPSNIEIDIAKLEVGMELKIKDLAVNKDYTIVDNVDKVIVRITAHKEESVEVEVATPVTEVTTEVKKEEKAQAEDEKAPEQKDTTAQAKPQSTPQPKK